MERVPDGGGSGGGGGGGGLLWLLLLDSSAICEIYAKAFVAEQDKVVMSYL